MKIAYILSVFPTLSETFILNQITGLIDLGHEVDIFAGSNSREDEIHQQVEQYQLLRRTFYFHEPRKKWARLRWLRLVRAVLVLLRSFGKGPWKLVRAFMIARRFGLPRLVGCLCVAPFIGRRYDIIQCKFGPNGRIGVLLKELGFEGKVAVSFHGYDVSRYVKTRGEDVYRTVFEKADLLMANSEHIKARLMGLGCDSAKIVVHRSGIDVAYFAFDKRRFEERRNINLLTVARLVEKKGVEYSLRAVARLVPKYPDLIYHIVGDGHQRLELESLTHKLGLEQVVRFLGAVNHDEVRRLMLASHIFILPSVTARNGDEEGIPNTLIEAQANGIPVLATLHAGIPELVTDGASGFLVPEKDVDALAERLEYLIQHPELWPEMGQVGRRFVGEHFSIKKLNERLAGLYQRLLQGRYDLRV